MSRSTFKVLFFLKRDKQKVNGMIPLFCRITVDGQEVRFGMKCDVNPKFWDIKAGKASGRTTEATKINALVDNTKAAIIKIYRDLQERDNYVTAETVRNVFLGATIWLIFCTDGTTFPIFQFVMLIINLYEYPMFYLIARKGRISITAGER